MMLLSVCALLSCIFTSVHTSCCSSEEDIDRPCTIANSGLFSFSGCCPHGVTIVTSNVVLRISNIFFNCSTAPHVTITANTTTTDVRNVSVWLDNVTLNIPTMKAPLVKLVNTQHTSGVLVHLSHCSFKVVSLTVPLINVAGEHGNISDVNVSIVHSSISVLKFGPDVGYEYCGVVVHCTVYNAAAAVIMLIHNATIDVASQGNSELVHVKFQHEGQLLWSSVAARGFFHQIAECCCCAARELFPSFRLSDFKAAGNYFCWQLYLSTSSWSLQESAATSAD